MRTLGTLAAVLLLSPIACYANDRFDLSARTGRSDAETVDWREWEIGAEERVAQPLAQGQVELRGIGAPLEGFLHKGALAEGASIAADGVVCDGGAIEVVLTGLPAGKHSLATYHNRAGEGSGELALQVGETQVAVTPSVGPNPTDKVATAYVEFEAGDAPITVRISAAPGAPVVLNAVELDASDPARRPMKPSPAASDGHVDAESGELELTWRPTPDASQYLV
ncbi:MAG: hypothetical protein KDA37_09510, partial [Planctomycetales bacterium]|nr:hypothetical protein [Planctomycetales bacterium]